MAQKQLTQNGHKVLLVNPRGGTVEGIKCFQSVSDILADSELNGSVETVTIYVKPAILCNVLTDIASLGPRRVIFNPGTESHEAISYLAAQDIEVEAACTLVLLSLGTY